MSRSPHWVGGAWGRGHDASGRCGSVRRLSDVRVSRSHVGDAQEGALTIGDGDHVAAGLTGTQPAEPGAQELLGGPGPGHGCWSDAALTGPHIGDGQVFVQPWPAGGTDRRRDQVIYYQYRAERARRTLHGIDEQVGKAEKAVVGKTAIRRNRFVQLTGATKSVNRALEAKARAVAGLKGYVADLAVCPDGAPVTAEFVIGAYHRLIGVEKSFRMSKHDLQARPIYHHKRDSIEAHLTIVFAALAVSRFIEQTTGWSIRKFVRTARRYRTIQIQAGAHTITAADPLPDDLRHALHTIHHSPGAH